MTGRTLVPGFRPRIAELPHLENVVRDVAAVPRQSSHGDRLRLMALYAFRLNAALLSFPVFLAQPAFRDLAVIVAW